MFSKKRTCYVVLVLILLFLPHLCLDLGFCNPNILSKQDNYIVSYQGIDDSSLNHIAAYDMAILEPLNVTNKQLKSLEKSGTITYGYQSIFEVEVYNEEKISLLNEDDYLYINGVRPTHKYYGCYYGDIRSPHYQEVLLDSIEKNVIAKGFTGVFFDTLDDIGYFIDEPVRTELFHGYIEFFKLLNETYPKLSIIQNRAFKLYTLGSAAYVDGLMFEGLEQNELESKDTSKFYSHLINDLSATAKDNNGVILALSYNNLDANEALAKELNWLWGTTP